jgi:uncharacterized protein with gpF-like domain
MTRSYEHWLRASYARALEANADAGRIPDLAMDDVRGGRTPGASQSDLFKEMRRLQAYWNDYFDKFAQSLAKRITDDWYRDNKTAWQGKLKRAGFDIELQLTAAQRTLLKTKVVENVALIKTIPQQYHARVEGTVLRSFTAGRDLKTMSEELYKCGTVTKHRAAFIARDQANKATAQMNSARQGELGITQAVWIHSSAGKEPRAAHVRAGRERWVFDTAKGIDFGDGFGFVRPGEAINCRCISRSIIPAIGRDLDPDHRQNRSGEVKLGERLKAKGVQALATGSKR